MSNKFYAPGPLRAAKVEDLFEAVAPKYDLINDLQSLGLHRRWKSRLVEMARAETGGQALDVCCGTGDIAMALSRHGASVTGLDFSEAMLDVARDRSRNEANHFARVSKLEPGTVAPPLQFVRGDALHLPFADESFDIVTVGYGLRNLASWERGLEEMWRVARAGGRVLVLEFGKPENAIWRWIYNGYLRFFVPVFGRVFCRDSATHAYIYASLRDYPGQRKIAEKMKGLGGKNVAVVDLVGGAMSINYAEKV